MLRLLLLVNAALICMIILMHTGTRHNNNKAKVPDSCAKKLNVDAVNSITIKLM